MSENIEKSLKKQSGTFQFICVLLFLVNEYARPMIFAKLRVVIIVEICFFVFLIFRKKSVDEHKDKIFLCWLFLLFEMVFHVFFATNNYWALQFFKSTLSYFLFFYAVNYFVDNVFKVRAFLLFFIFLNAYCALIGILSGGFVPLNGLMADENDFALAMNVALPITFYYSFTVKRLFRFLLWFLTALMFIAGVYSLSRGGMVGVVAVIGMIWMKSQRKTATLLLLLLSVPAFWHIVPQEYKVEVVSVFEEGGEVGTGRERIEFWKVATRVFLANPVLGVGQGNLPHRLGEYQGEEYWKRGIQGRAVHSLYFTLLPELGLLGTIIFIIMLVKIVGYCFELSRGDDEGKNYALGVMIGIFGYLITGLFLSVLYYPHFWVLITLGNMLWVNNKKGEFRANSFERSKK